MFCLPEIYKNILKNVIEIFSRQSKDVIFFMIPNFFQSRDKIVNKIIFYKN